MQVVSPPGGDFGLAGEGAISFWRRRFTIKISCGMTMKKGACRKDDRDVNDSRCEGYGIMRTAVAMAIIDLKLMSRMAAMIDILCRDATDVCGTD